MKLQAEFEERGYKVQAFMPTSAKEPLEWIVKVFKDGKLVRELKIPMHHEPRFGVSSIDIQILEEETAKLMESLP